MNLATEKTKSLALDAIEDLKALDVRVLDVHQKSSFTDYMIFASGSSNRHVKSIADSLITKSKEANQPPLGIEGEEGGEWVLVDLGDVVVHIMLPQTRAYYDLESLWKSGEEAESAVQDQ